MIPIMDESNKHCTISTPAATTQENAAALLARFLAETAKLANQYGVHCLMVTASIGVDPSPAQPLGGQVGQTALSGCHEHASCFAARAVAMMTRSEIDVFMRAFHDALATRNFAESVAVAQQKASAVATAPSEADLLSMPMPGGKPCKPS